MKTSYLDNAYLIECNYGNNYNFPYCVAKLPVLRSTLPENSAIDAGFNSKDIALKYALRISDSSYYTYVFKDDKAVAVVTPQGTVSYFEKD